MSDGKEDYSMSRRQLLGAGATGIAGLLSGCGSTDNEPENMDSATETFRRTGTPTPDYETCTVEFNLDSDDFLEGEENSESLYLTFSEFDSQAEEYVEKQRKTISVERDSGFSIAVGAYAGGRFKLGLTEFEDEDEEHHYVAFATDCEGIEILDRSEGSNFGATDDGSQYELGRPEYF